MPKPSLRIDQDRVDVFPRGVAAVLTVIDQPQALVTDLSQVFDFWIGEADPIPPEVLEQLSVRAGRPVLGFHRVWEVARDIEARDRPAH